MSIQQHVKLDASPAQVYQVLADSSALSALSGKSGQPGRTAGAEFSAFDGNVVGRQIELVPGERLIQAWRFPVWEPGAYSIVRFTLTAEDGGTLLSLEQHGVPADWQEHVNTNWPTFYLRPLADHFAAQAG
jgi:activator of HSP90 ATPase